MWEAVVADWRTAPVGEGRMAVLVFLEKLTMRPDELGRDDVDAVLAAGVSEQALRDAVKVCALFNMIVRMADSLGWDVPTWESCLARADGMLERGYSLA